MTKIKQSLHVVTENAFWKNKTCLIFFSPKNFFSFSLTEKKKISFPTVNPFDTDNQTG